MANNHDRGEIAMAGYAEGKRHMERVMLESPGDWPWIVVRVPATLGPDDPSGRFPFWLSRILDGGTHACPTAVGHPRSYQESGMLYRCVSKR